MMTGRGLLAMVSNSPYHRLETRQIMKEIKATAVGSCDCGMMVVDGCRRCLPTEIFNRLQRVGYNCVICTTGWINLEKILHIHNLTPLGQQANRVLDDHIGTFCSGPLHMHIQFEVHTLLGPQKADR